MGYKRLKEIRKRPPEKTSRWRRAHFARMEAAKNEILDRVCFFLPL
jgi:hypothetical protein